MSTAALKTVNDGVPGLSQRDVFATDARQQVMSTAWD